MFRFITSCTFLFVLISAVHAQDDLTMWYDSPADNWNEALPVGNGSLGAMVFGGVVNERIQVNEESVWAGAPEDFVNPQAKKSLANVRSLLFQGKYIEAQTLAQNALMGEKKNMSAYQTLGDLNFAFNHGSHKATDYKRSLNLRNATINVSYAVDDVNFTRTIFSSAPHNIVVIHLTADKERSITFDLSFSRPGNKADVDYAQDEILVSEHINDGRGVKLASRIKVFHTNGIATFSNDGLSFQGVDRATIVVAAATNYRGDDPGSVAQSRINKMSEISFDKVLETHVQDYQSFFNRVSLDLGKTDARFFPTDQRLKALQNGSSDPSLIAMYYQFGRYLLISSSRPGGLPANLQGIWADGLNPPWSADYHININIQMNYWPAEIAGMSEMHEPFFHFLRELATDGKKTARDMYGIPGAVAHFTTDAWHFTEPYGKTQWAMWPMGYAWSVQHLWQHYLFTEDKMFLDSLAYPLMKEAASFCLAWLVRDPRTGKLVSGPSISPENTFKTKTGEIATMVMGPTMDHMIIRELLRSTIEAGTILKKDRAFLAKLSLALNDLSPTVVTKDGRIMEWTEEFEEAEPGHRHISHLYGLFPGNEITMQSRPDLLDAARKTIEHRLANGGGHTGWSRAWIINFYARLHDGIKAHENLVALLQKSTLPNLFDNHPPFQIDGNFGAVSGITEMLMQSHADELHILPALPSGWANGQIKGIGARGAFDVDVQWENGELTRVRILSKRGNTCRVRYKDRVATLSTSAGKVYDLNGFLQLVN